MEEGAILNRKDLNPGKRRQELSQKAEGQEY